MENQTFWEVFWNTWTYSKWERAQISEIKLFLADLLWSLIIFIIILIIISITILIITAWKNVIKSKKKKKRIRK